MWLVSDNYGFLWYIHRYLMTRKRQRSNKQFVLSKTRTKQMVKRTNEEIMSIPNREFHEIIFLTYLIGRWEKIAI